MVVLPTRDVLRLKNWKKFREFNLNMKRQASQAKIFWNSDQFWILKSIFWKVLTFCITISISNFNYLITSKFKHQQNLFVLSTSKFVLEVGNIEILFPKGQIIITMNDSYAAEVPLGAACEKIFDFLPITHFKDFQPIFLKKIDIFGIFSKGGRYCFVSIFVGNRARGQ